MPHTDTMDKCRICLGNRKNLVSIFNKDADVSYADMITSLANVKVVQEDRIADCLCRSCCRKLREAYDFKNLIESSDLELYKITNIKKINFCNLNDIKIKIEIEPNPVIKCEDVNRYFKEGVDEICYSDTIIKKLDNSNGDEQSQNPIPVLDFLKTIKDEPYDDNNENDDYDINNYSGGADTDDEYVPPYKLLKKEKTKRKYKKHKSIKKANTKNDHKKNTSPKICIKPICLNDLKLVHSYSPKPKGTTKKVYPTKLEMCPHCGKMTGSLNSHILQHTGERKFKCDECDKKFFTASCVEKHKKRHSDIRNFKCDQCLAAFIDKGSLKSHMRTHSDKIHVCDICSKAFKRINTLKRHKLMHNSANKTIMCELCNMSFFTNPALKHHMRVHTGERPYNCEICKQPYSYKHDFNRHCFKKHGVFLKRRSVYVMNEEVLKQERILMRDLMLRVNGVIKDDKPLNPFEGPQAHQAFEMAVKALESMQIPIDI